MGTIISYGQFCVNENIYKQNRDAKNASLSNHYFSPEKNFINHLGFITK